MLHSKHPHHKRRREILFILILVVGGALAYFTFYDSSNITGATIGLENGSAPSIEGPTFTISSTLSLPDMELECYSCGLAIEMKEFDTSDISIDSDFNIRKVEDATLVIEGYKGKIILTKPETFTLNGKLISISINGVTIDKKDKLFSVFTNLLSFESLSVSNILVENIAFTSSGEINIGEENTFKLNEKRVEIGSFVGEITSSNSTFNMEGEISSLKIDGYPGVSIG